MGEGGGGGGKCDFCRSTTRLSLYVSEIWGKEEGEGGSVTSVGAPLGCHCMCLRYGGRRRGEV